MESSPAQAQTRQACEELAAGRKEEAAALFRQALAKARAEFGPRSPRVGDYLANLATCLQSLRQSEEAERLYRELLALHPAGSFPAADAQDRLAKFLLQQGRLDEAEPLQRHALAVFERVPKQEWRFANGASRLAEILFRTERPGEAEPWQRRVLQRRVEHHGPTHPQVAEDLAALAAILERAGGAREAEGPARGRVAIYEDIFRETGQESPRLFPARRDYYELLARLGYRSRTAQLRLRTLSEGGDPGPLPAAEPAPGPDFDALARAAAAPRAAAAETERLHAALFALPAWHFPATGGEVHTAAHPGLINAVPMVKAFTDPERLALYARDHGLAAEVRSIEVSALGPSLQAWLDRGLTHLHFNADDCSDGFYLTLRQALAGRPSRPS